MDLNEKVAKSGTTAELSPHSPLLLSEAENGHSEAGLMLSNNNVPDGAVPSEEANITDLVPEAPDGGWGWVIVFCSFMNHFIIDGIGYAFGTMLADYQAYFNSSAAATGALMSTLIGCYLLSGK